MSSSIGEDQSIQWKKKNTLTETLVPTVLYNNNCHWPVFMWCWHL